VEGALASELIGRHSNNRVSSFIQPMSQLSSGNAHDSHAAFLQPSIAALVARRLVTHIVAYAINFDRKPGFGAIEIENVRSDWMLAAKNWLARIPGAQPDPKLRFKR
jgi:hypothetical protein